MPYSEQQRDAHDGDEGLVNMQVSSPTCFESRGGAPKPVIVKISSKEPADVIPPIGFNACYKDVVGSPYKCLAFSIVQSCADSSMLAIGAPVSGPIASPSGTTAGRATVIDVVVPLWCMLSCTNHNCSCERPHRQSLGFHC